MEAALEKSRGHIRKQRAKPSNITEFEKWEAKQKGGWNYEFYYGEIIKKGGMKQSEAILVAFLLKCFMSTEAQKNDGNLFQEIDIFIDEQRKRVADLAFFNREQMIAMATGQKEIPTFVIELLSKNEMFGEVEAKLQDYFDIGVQLVWYISPTSKKIYAYTLTNEFQIYTSGSTATANPVLPDFKVDIDKLFTIA